MKVRHIIEAFWWWQKTDAQYDYELSDALMLEDFITGENDIDYYLSRNRSIND